MSAASEIRIDPSIGLAFGLPVLSIVEQQLRLDWPSRRSVVVVETEGSIRRTESEQRRKAGAQRRSSSRRRPVMQTRARPKNHTDGLLSRLIDAKDSNGLLDHFAPSPERAEASIGALMSFDGRAHANPERILHVLSTADPARLTAFSTGRVAVRSLLAVDAGVLARVPTSDTMLALLRSQLHEELDDENAAAAELAGDPIDSVALIRRCALARDSGRFESVLDATARVRSLDDSTSYLCVMRGSAAATLGHESESSAAFSEAVRLARTNQRIVVRMLLERGRYRVARGHLRRALMDLRRIQGLEPGIEGIDKAIRTLARRR